MKTKNLNKFITFAIGALYVLVGLLTGGLLLTKTPSAVASYGASVSLGSQVWLDPISGDDSYTGESKDQALKTLEEASKKVEKNSTIVVVNPIEISEDKTIDFGAGLNVTLLRYYNSDSDNFAGNMFEVLNSATLAFGNVTIDGNDFTSKDVDCDSAVCATSNSKVIIYDGFSAINNTSTENGGFINLTNSNLIIHNGYFYNNTTELNGGLIFSNGGDVVINNGNFDNDSTKTVAANGGLIAFEGEGKLNIFGGSFKSSNVSANGGVVYVSNNNAQISLLNATFSDNKATNEGGAVYAVGEETTPNINVNIDSCTFSKNTANLGAAMFLYHCKEVNLVNSLIEENSIESSSEDIYGGVVGIDNGSTEQRPGLIRNIDNCIFANNKSKGMLFVVSVMGVADGSSSYKKNTYTRLTFRDNAKGGLVTQGGIIDNCSFINNGYYAIYSSNHTQLLNSNLEYNQGAILAGSLFKLKDNVTIKNNVVTDKPAVASNRSSGHYEINGDNIYIYNNYANLSIDHSNLDTNVDLVPTANSYQCNFDAGCKDQAKCISISDTSIYNSKIGLYLPTTGFMPSPLINVENGKAFDLSCFTIDNPEDFENPHLYIQDGKIYIKEISASEINYIANDYKAVYDALYHTIDVNLIDADPTFQIRYGLTEGVYDLEEPPMFKEAVEETTIYFQITADGKPTVTDSRTITILQQDVSIKINGSAAKLTGWINQTFTTTTELNPYLQNVYACDVFGRVVVGRFYATTQTTISQTTSTIKIKFVPDNRNYAQSSELQANVEISYDNLWYKDGKFYPQDPTTSTDYGVDGSSVNLNTMLGYIKAGGSLTTNSTYIVNADTQLTIEKDLTIKKYTNTIGLFNVATGNTLDITVKPNANLQFVGITTSEGAPLIVNNGVLQITGSNNITFKDNFCSNNGGGISSLDATLNIKGVIFTNLSAKSQGGAIYATNTESFVVENCQIVGCSSENTAGAIYITSNTESEFAVINTTIQKNTATSNGGGIYVDAYAKLIMHGGSLLENEATSRYGGGIYTANNSSIQLLSVEICRNKAFSNGGGAYVMGEATFSGCMFALNEAGSNGGALHLGDAAIVNIDGCVLNNNAAGGYGKSIYAVGGTSQLNVDSSDVDNIYCNGAVVGTLSGSIKINEALQYYVATCQFTIGKLTKDAFIKVKPIDAEISEGTKLFTVDASLANAQLSQIHLISDTYIVDVDNNKYVIAEGASDYYIFNGDVDEAISNGLLGKIILVNDTISISTDMDIDGKNTVWMRGDISKPMLNVSAGNVVLKNFVFIGSKDATKTGNQGLINNDGTLTIRSSKFSSVNTVSSAANGAVIYGTGALSLNSCEFINIKTTNSSIVYINTTQNVDITLQNLNFVNNTAKNLISCNAKLSLVKNISATNNTITDKGSSLYILMKNNLTTTVEDIYFNNNGGTNYCEIEIDTNGDNTSAINKTFRNINVYNSGSNYILKYLMNDRINFILEDSNFNNFAGGAVVVYPKVGIGGKRLTNSTIKMTNLNIDRGDFTPLELSYESAGLTEADITSIKVYSGADESSNMSLQKKVKDNFKSVISIFRVIKITIENSIVNANNKQRCIGVYDINNTSGYCNIKNCSLIKGNALLGGGLRFQVIRYQESYGSISLENCDFVENTAICQGSAVFAEGHYTNTYFSLCRFYKNYCIGDYNHPDRPPDDASGYFGGTVHFGGSEKMERTTFKNCDFVENIADHNSSGILTRRDLKILNCNFIDNKSNAQAAIQSTSADLDVDGCYFSGNTGKDQGGVIYLTLYAAGTAYAHIKNSVFINNYGGGNGMGLILLEGGSEIPSIVDNCVFKYNKTGGNSSCGVIILKNKDSKITNCKFIGNIDKSDNFIKTQANNIENCLFEGNEFISLFRLYKSSSQGNSQKINLKNCVFANNRQTAYTMFTYEGLKPMQITVEDSEFYGNVNTGTANTIDGQAPIFYCNSSGSLRTTYSFVNCNFYDNHSTYRDSRSGLFYVTNADLNLTNCNMSNNGYVYNEKYYQNNIYVEGSTSGTIIGGAVNMDGCTVSARSDVSSEKNTQGLIYISPNANPCTITNCVIENANIGENSVIVNEGKLKIINLTAYNNTSSGNGSCIVNLENGRLTIEDSLFKNNQAKNGGVIYNAAKGILTLDNACFVGNHATNNDVGGGGAIYNLGNLTINSAEFKQNTSKYGGAIFNLGEVAINDAEFTNNYVTLAGGAIYNAKDATNQGFVNINYAKFVSNGASNNVLVGDEVYGYAIANQGALNIYSAIFDSNKKQSEETSFNGGRGGDLFVYENATTNILNAQFKHSSAILGASIYLKENAEIKISNSTFEAAFEQYTVAENVEGFFIYAKGANQIDIKNCSFSSNGEVMAQSGLCFNGGFANIIGSIFESIAINAGSSTTASILSAINGSSVVFSDCVIRNIDVNNNVVMLNGSSVVFENCNVENNFIESNFVHADANSNVQISDCQLKNNTFDGYGADSIGLFNINGGSKLTLNNCQVEGNTSNKSNTVFAGSNYNAEFINTTIQNNIAKEGAVLTFNNEDNSTATFIYENIITGNKAPEGAIYVGEIAATTNSSFVIGNSSLLIVKDNYAVDSNGNHLKVDGNITTNEEEYAQKNIGFAQSNQNNKHLYGGLLKDVIASDGLLKSSIVGVHIVASSVVESGTIVLSQKDSAVPILTNDLMCLFYDNSALLGGGTHVLALKDGNIVVELKTGVINHVFVKDKAFVFDGRYKSFDNSDFEVYRGGSKLDYTQFIVKYAEDEKAANENKFIEECPKYASLGEYTIYYKLFDLSGNPLRKSDGTEYEVGTVKISFVKSYLTLVEAPVANVEKGEPLSNATFSGGKVVSNGRVVAGVWSFTQQNTVPGDTTTKYEAVFTAASQKTYSNIIKVEIAVDYLYDAVHYIQSSSGNGFYYSGIFSNSEKMLFTGITKLSEMVKRMKNNGIISIRRTYTFTESEKISADVNIDISPDVTTPALIFDFDNTVKTVEFGGGIGKINIIGRTYIGSDTQLFKIQSNNTLILGSNFEIGQHHLTTTSTSTGATTAKEGLIYNLGTLKINGATIKGNQISKASNNGCAIIYNTGLLTINSGEFVGNIHKQNSTDLALGGLIYNTGSTAKVVINGGLFEGNSVTQNSSYPGESSYGGVIYNNQGEVDICGGTFVHNSAGYGGVIANKSGKVVLSGGIMQNNYATTDNAVVYSEAGSVVNAVVYNGTKLLENYILVEQTPSKGINAWGIVAIVFGVVVIGVVISFAIYKAVYNKQKLQKVKANKSHKNK